MVLTRICIRRSVTPRLVAISASETPRLSRSMMCLSRAPFFRRARKRASIDRSRRSGAGRGSASCDVSMGFSLLVKEQNMNIARSPSVGQEKCPNCDFIKNFRPLHPVGSAWIQLDCRARPLNAASLRGRFGRSMRPRIPGSPFESPVFARPIGPWRPRRTGSPFDWRLPLRGWRNSLRPAIVLLSFLEQP